MNRALERTTGTRLVRVDGATPEPAPEPPPQPAPQPAESGSSSKKTLLITAPTEDEVRPPAHPETDRLLRRPIFLMTPVRSGSTLLRLMMDRHSMLHAPHELHVRRLRVVPTTSLARKAMELLGHDEADLEHLLWDRVLHRELQLSGKRFIVDKTPSNTFVYRRIATCWPDARFIFLLRHPASIAASWADASVGKRDRKEATRDALSYMRSLEKARSNLSGLTVRYEDLTVDAEKVTREICAYLDLPWESEMLEYGGDQQLVKGVGDWSEKIRSGSVQQGRPVPSAEDVPKVLRSISRKWGYLPDA
ncbi:MAG: hypothetical protein QOF53_120 [Nocardioidaceae bacterium]|nr:hypothetical protein [Nocardioidaceae bacterium]